MVLDEIKNFAVKLKEKGYTLNVYVDGELVLVVGKNAKPGILGIFAPIEIKNLKKVLEIYASDKGS